MKTIGIKLADGSFYPVLNEGAPSERLLELTTAHNNQTKVMVDLYRSELGSMEDAEYVDSLQIEDLNEHPNGEPTLTFTVSIDENNKLSAKMVDNETGLQSNATITLVSRTLEERLLPDEYDIKDPTVEGLSLTETEENSLFGNDDKEDSADDENPLVDFSFETEPNPTFADADSEPTVDVINEFEAPVDETSVGVEEEVTEDNTAPADVEIPEISDFNPLDEPILEDDALAIDEFNGENDNTVEEKIEAEETTEEKIEEEPAEQAEESSDKVDFTFDIPDDTVQNSDDESVSEEKESSEEVNPSEEISFSDEISPSEKISLSDDTSASEEINPSEDFVSDLPSFDFSSISDSSGDLDLTETDTRETKEEDLNLDLDLPDFDSIPDEPAEETTFASDSSSAAGSESFNSDLDLSDLDTYSQTESPADDNSYLDDLDFDDLDTSTKTSQSTGKPISFTGLYDKETELGNSAASEGEAKNTRPAVIICILCAIICLLATLFVIMVIPAKFNIFGNKKAAKEDLAKTELSVTELPSEKNASALAEEVHEQLAEPAPEPEPIEKPEPLPPVPESKEEEVLIIENAEDVVPLPPPVKPVKPKDISYKIKWGDTLWDISDTYYKNPWRYKYIARYNGIKNPDYIISGTYITIPAE